MAINTLLQADITDQICTGRATTPNGRASSLGAFLLRRDRPYMAYADHDAALHLPARDSAAVPGLLSSRGAPVAPTCVPRCVGPPRDPVLAARRP